MLPFGVPGIVLGLGLLWAYAYLPLPLYGTLTLIVLAYVTRFLPYATETIGGTLRAARSQPGGGGMDRGREPAFAALWRILMPLSLPSLQSSYFLLFMAFFREISVDHPDLHRLDLGALGFDLVVFEQANWGLASALSILAMVLCSP